MQRFKKRTARLLAFLMTAAMIFSMLPMAAFAEENEISAASGGVGVIKSFGNLEEPFVKSDESENTYLLAVEPNTELDGLNLPAELTATVERATEALEPVEDESGTEALGEGQEEAVLTTIESEIIPVTWTSDEEYAPFEEGSFLFTAQLPEGYVLEEGIEMPQVSVFAGVQTFGAEAGTYTNERGVTPASVTTFAELQQAFEDAVDGDVIQLTQDITGQPNEQITFAEDMTVTLDLNGCTLTGTPSAATGVLGFINVGSDSAATTLKIIDSSGTDNGVIKSSAEVSKAVISNTGAGTVRIESGSIIAEVNKLTAIFNKGAASTIEVAGGEVKHTLSGSASDSAKAIQNENGSVNVSDGTVSTAATSGMSAAIVSTDGNVTVSGGLVTSTTSIMGTISLSPSNPQSTLTIEGGTVENTAADRYAVYMTSDCIYSHTGGTVGKVYPSYSIGGTITGIDAPGGLAATLQLKDSAGNAVGAPVTAWPNGSYTIKDVPKGTGYTIEVTMEGYSNGTITAFDVSDDVSGKNLELKKSSKIQTFAQLQQAFANAEDGDVIQLANDINEPSNWLTFDKDMTVTLDLNGCTLTGKTPGISIGVINVGAASKLTIIDSSDSGDGAIVSASEVDSGFVVSNAGTVKIEGGSIIAKADKLSAVRNTGTIEVAGGAVKHTFAGSTSNGAIAIFNIGASVIVSSGTVSTAASSGISTAIASVNGQTTVSGGTVTSATDTYGTIDIYASNAIGCILAIEGGIVENTAVDGYAVYFRGSNPFTYTKTGGIVGTVFPSYKISGTVKDSETKAPLAATIQLEDKAGNVIGGPVTAKADGTYSIPDVVKGSNYSIIVEMDGYKKFEFNIPSLTADLTKDILLVDSTPKNIGFTSATADGSSGSDTSTKLTLKFADDIANLVPADITLTGATAGKLTMVDNKTYTLSISGITVADGETVKVALAKDGYAFTPAFQDVAVYKSNKIQRTKHLDFTGEKIFKQEGSDAWGAPTQESIDAMDVEGWKWDQPTNTLTLNGLDMESNVKTAIKLPADSHIVLESNVTIKNTWNMDPGYIIQLDSGDLTMSGKGTLQCKQTDKGYGLSVASDGNLKISGKDLKIDMETLNGTGIFLAGASNFEFSEASADIVIGGAGNYGFAINDEFVLNSGNLTINNEGGSAIFSQGDVSIKGGKLDVKSANKSIDSKKSVMITGGEINVESSGVGIATSKGATITGGKVNVESKNNGISAAGDVTITGGEVNVVSLEEAGLYVVPGNISITGGKVSINSEKQGLATNDSIKISGKNTEVKIETKTNRVCWKKPELQDVKPYDKDGNLLEEDAAWQKIGEMVIYKVVAPPSTAKSVTVNGSYAAVTGAGSYDAGATVSIHAGDRNGYKFTGWTSSDGVAFANANSAATTFVMPAKDVTITANWSKKDDPIYEPSGGGSSSSGGGGGSASTPTTKDELTNGTATVAPTVDDNGNVTVAVTDKVVLEAIKAAQDAAKKEGLEGKRISVEIIAKTDNASSQISATLPKTVQETLISNKVDAVKITTNTITMSFSQSAISKMNAQAKADVTITAVKADTAELTGEAKKLIGARPMFDLNAVYGNGEHITEFGSKAVTVAIPYELGEGEEADDICAIFVDENDNASILEDSSYDEDLEAVVFTTNHFSKYAVGYEAKDEETEVLFIDIDNHWAKADIEAVAIQGIFAGTDDKIFSPDMPMTRGMFVAVLGRMAAVETENYQNGKFTDVKADMYYAPYINWAAEKGIVAGMSSTSFAPDKNVTRQEMAAMIASFSKANGVALPQTLAETTFADNDTIASWSADAVKQMQMAGLLAGKDANRFDPTGIATRAEVAATLHRYVKLGADDSAK